MHPQNVVDTELMHAEIVELARKPGWTAMTVEDYLDWLLALDALTCEWTPDGRAVVPDNATTIGMTLRWPDSRGWRRELCDGAVSCH